MTTNFRFWKRHTQLQAGSLLALLTTGLAQVLVLHLLISQTAPTTTGIVVRGITLIILPFLSTFFASRMAAYSTNKLQLTLLNNLSHTSTNEVEQVHAHTFSKVITLDVDHVYQFWRELFSHTGFNLPVLLYLTSFLFLHSSPLYVAGFTVLGITLAGMAYQLNKRVRAKHRQHHQSFVVLQDRIQNYIGNILQFRLYRSEANYLKTVRTDLTEFSKLSAELSQNRHLFTTYISSVLLFLLWGGLWFVQHDDPVSPSDLAIITLIFLEIRRIGTELFITMHSYQRAQESVGRLTHWLTEPLPKQQPAPTLHPLAAIRIDSLIFRYKNSTDAIHYPDLAIGVGERVWLQGHNGRGKSTLWKIITGLYTESTTTVWLDNAPKQGTGLTPFFAHISAVTEPARCYSGMLWEIIGNFSAERQVVVDWLSQQRLLALFDTYPDQLDTYYDSAVNNVSAGQLKWLVLVQAFFLQPKMLILDEPFSSLDVHRQCVVLRLIEELPPSTTLVVISHHEIAIPFDKTIQL